MVRPGAVAHQLAEEPERREEAPLREEVPEGVQLPEPVSRPTIRASRRCGTRCRAICSKSST